jgi:tetratricopeptide (TPR) repeat protein
MQNNIPLSLQLVAIILKIKGDLYHEVENYHVAIGYYKQALNSVPQANRINYLIAQSYQALGQLQQAKKYLSLSGEAGIKLTDPYYQEVKNTTVGEIPYLIKAKSSLVHGDIKQAIKEYNKALEFNPSSESAMVNLGVSYYQNKQLEEAQKRFEQVLQSNPQQLVALYNLATILRQQNKIEQSTKYFEDYLQLNANDNEAKVNLAQLYYQQQKYDQVVNLANTKSMASNEAVQILKAQSLSYQQHYAEAMALMNEINKFKPGNRSLLLMLSNLYSQVPELTLRDAEQSLLFATQANNLKQDSMSMWHIIIALDEAGKCKELALILNEFAQLVNKKPADIYKQLGQKRGNNLRCIIEES